MKHLFIIIHLVLISITAVIGVDVMYHSLGLKTDITLPEKPAVFEKNGSGIQKATPSSNRKVYDQIINRNLFKVMVKPKPKDTIKPVTPKKSTTKEKPLSLHLKLWGTVLGGAQTYAVIEDTKLRKQFLLQSNETIGEAVIKDIHRNKVILEYRAQKIVLETVINEAKNTPSKKSGFQSVKSKAPSFPPVMQPNEIQVNTSVLDQILTNADPLELINKVKTRPYLSNGNPEGLMVYGIRPGSAFGKIGIKNGDIVKEYNGTPVNSKNDLSQFMELIKQGDETRVTLMRQGRTQHIVYTHSQ